MRVLVLGRPPIAGLFHTPGDAPAGGAPTPTPTPTPTPSPTPTPAPTPTPTPTPAPAPAPGTPGTPQAGAEGTPAPGAPAAPERVVPESYTLQLPDGSALDQDDVKAISDIAKAKKWTNDEAQAALTEMHEQIAAQRTRMHDALVAHPEVGGAHLEAAQANAFKALDRFLPATSPEGAEFRAAMNKSGYGDYAPLVLLLSRIGKAMSEDSPVITDLSRSAAAVDPVQRLYGAKA